MREPQRSDRRIGEGLFVACHQRRDQEYRAELETEFFPDIATVLSHGTVASIVVWPLGLPLQDLRLHCNLKR
jgi:hypothetical protein